MTRKKKISSALLIFLILAGCNSGKGVFVNLKNAPLTSGNLNSAETYLGELYVYDTHSGGQQYIYKQIEGTLVSDNTGGNIIRKLHSKVDIDFGGDIIGRKSVIQTQIAKLFSFEIKKHQSKKFRYPREVLNGRENAYIRADLRDDGIFGDRYRFFFIHRVTSGDTVKIFADTDNEINILDNTIKVNWDEEEINAISNAKNYPSIVQVSVWKLVEDNQNETNPENTPTGYKFVPDTEKDSVLLFQQVFNRTVKSEDNEKE